MTGFDPTKLTATDTGEALLGTSNADPYKRLEGTPFAADLRASYERGKASSYTVPDADAAKKVVGLLRLAAAKESLGVRVVDKPGKGGAVTVVFQGKKRAQHNTDARLPRRHKGESDADWNARVSEWESVSGLKYTERRAELDAVKEKAAARGQRGPRK